ncbi:cytochrome P450 89A2-like [Pyrus ussuriensis x Pyrus communis]|uniref:Cytochrome P450 89A2-like n=1 Tax=Pyrus ussuriensis x Pyrus communis TaxID=2448454 RepID=A0A5N5F6G5_9ROSA|nr:cytochrome P450 89A2-like [Pyrus ussuriensis x Pyrus communis]
MKTAEREPMGKEMMGPYCACSSRMMSSISKKGFRIHKKPPMMGMERGPGGSLGLETEVGRNRERRGLRRKETQRAMRIRNQVSMVNCKQ